MSVIVDQICIVGLGLLGGSLALAIKQRHLARKVIALVRKQQIAHNALNLNVVDAAMLDPAQAVSEADMVVLCTPVGVMEELARTIGPHLKSGAVVTDVGSTKHRLVTQLTPLFRTYGAEFVGAHPLAGSEKSGLGYARADLFERALCVITPSTDSQPWAIQKVRHLWEAVGCRTVVIPSEKHDIILAKTSHLPHLVAAALVHHVLGGSNWTNTKPFCATGFADTTRIASGEPQLWVDISRHNCSNLVEELRQFARDLFRLADLIELDHEQELYAFLDRARQLRNSWLAEDHLLSNNADEAMG